MRLSVWFWAAMLLMGALAVYEVKYEVRDVKQHVRSLDREIAQEKEALHVLEAEWAYLTRPERLRRLSEKHLTLGPVKPVQIRDEANLELPDRASASSLANAEGKVP